MASSPLSASSFLLLIAAVALLISPVSSQTCKAQKFTQTNTSLASCMDLPTLKAQIHWTYDPSGQRGPTLNITYVAPPAKPDGWVAWALNPTDSGMIGSQALVAFRDTNGSVVVKTYNISSYGPIAESPISYEVLRKRAEYSGGVMRIFATLALPAGEKVVNQVWQVGASVTDGVPVKHEFSPENLKSKGTLQLGREAADNGATPPPAPPPTRGNDAGGGWRIHESGLGLHGVLVLLGVVLWF